MTFAENITERKQNERLYGWCDRPAGTVQYRVLRENMASSKDANPELPVK